jgi:5'-methylthioadenosine phosphorylase
MFGVISGSGLYEIPGLEIEDRVVIDTPYGEASDHYITGRLSGKKVVFLPRHGSGHRIQPHKINYRANIWGFRKLGADRLISIGATGGIRETMRPGSISVPDQIIDITSGRLSTFYDGEEVVHVDFTEPFCPDLRGYIIEAGARSGVALVNAGTYICVNGPRLETAAEIKTFSLWGGDIVGMTMMPEAVLARELGICYGGISVITNFAAGVHQGRLTVSEVTGTMRSTEEKLGRLLHELFAIKFTRRSCSCKQSLEDAGASRL